MYRLLSANFMRLKKDKIFWISFIFMSAAGIVFPILRYRDMKLSGTINNIDNGFFGCALFIGIIMAVFCSLFIGTEHSDGTVKNKIIAGQKRDAVYLSIFITCSVAAIILCLIFFIPYLCVGIPLLGFFTSDIKIILLMGFTVFVLAVAFSSIYTLIAMLCQNKAMIAVVCILLSFGLLETGSILNRMLEAPETVPSYTIGNDGEPAVSEVPNTKYLDGTKRKVVQSLYHMLPGGQAMQCILLQTVHLPVLPVYSFIVIVLTTGIGLGCFKRKDLK